MEQVQTMSPVLGRGGDEPVKVGYLGPPGTFSHEAALRVVGDGPGLLCPYPTIPAVFAALEGGQIETGVVPVENSLEGSVVQTMDILARSRDVQVRGSSHSH